MVRGLGGEGGGRGLRFSDFVDVGAGDEVFNEEVAVGVEAAAHLFYGCVLEGGVEATELGFAEGGAFDAFDGEGGWLGCCRHFGGWVYFQWYKVK